MRSIIALMLALTPAVTDLSPDEAEWLAVEARFAEVSPVAPVQPTPRCVVRRLEQGGRPGARNVVVCG